MTRALALFGCGACVFGCARPWEGAVERASNEFVCPREQVHVLERADIANGLFDVEACGQRARYACRSSDDADEDDEAVVGASGSQCVREPNPATWDPDPIVVGTLPADMPGKGVKRTCRDPTDDGCLGREGSDWRWRPRNIVSGM